MKKVFWLAVFILVVIGLLYSKQYQKNNQPANKTTETEEVNSNLKLEVTSPKDKATTPSAIIKVEGITGPNAEVFVNEKELRADDLGNFSTEYELFEGENNIYVSANDSQGNYAEKLIIVYLESRQ